jgi:hypothetical protein
MERIDIDKVWTELIESGFVRFSHIHPNVGKLQITNKGIAAYSLLYELKFPLKLKEKE